MQHKHKPQKWKRSSRFLHLLPLSLTLSLIPFISNAQKSKAGAPAAASSGGSGAKASAGTSGGGSYVSGFSYKLPRNYHLEYKTVSDITRPTETKADDHRPYAYQLTVISNTTKWNVPTSVPANNNPLQLPVIRLNRTVNFPASGISFNEFYYGTFSQNTVFLTPAVSAATTYLLNNPTVVTKATRTITLDTIDRYFPSRSFWHDLNPFKQRRLRVSVTPSDSGKLLVVIKKNQNFRAGSVPADSHFVIYQPTNELSPAIPITTSDSAKNFFLTVTPRSLVNQYPIYLPLRYSIIQYGAVTIPFKYRFHNNRPIGGNSDPTKPFASGVTAPSESTASINVAAYIGKKWGSTRFYYDASDTHNTVSCMAALFAGPSLFSLSANNVNYGTDMNKVSSQQLALSTGAAFTLEWRTVNFGVFYGYDIPVEKSPWVYRYKNWVGFGIGFSLGMFTNSNALSQSSGN